MNKDKPSKIIGRYYLNRKTELQSERTVTEIDNVKLLQVLDEMYEAILQLQKSSNTNISPEVNRQYWEIKNAENLRLLQQAYKSYK